MMILKQIVRRLFKNKELLLLSVFSLALSMIAGIFIFQYVLFEFSFDTFHKNADRIYRVERSVIRNELNDEDGGITTSLKEYDILRTKISGVENVVRLHPVFGDAIIRTNDDSFNESNLYYADSSFFSIFSFKICHGNPGRALRNPDGVAISKSMSLKLFGSVNALNKKVEVIDRYTGKKHYYVTTVFEDLPLNTHLNVNMLLPMQNALKFPKYSEENPWKWANFRTYIKINKHVNPDNIVNQLHTYVEAQEIASGIRCKQVRYTPVPVSSIHLNGGTDNYKASSAPVSILLLIFIGIIVIAVAWINYFNLSLVKLAGNQTRTGIKKVLGAKFRMFSKEFIIESLFISTLSLIFASAFYFFFENMIYNYFNIHIALSFVQIALIWFAMFLIYIILSVFSGLLMSLKIFRSKELPFSRLTKAGTKNLSIRFLTSVQFVAAIFIICFSLLAIKQLNYLYNKELGFDKEKVLIIRSPRLCDKGQNIHHLRHVFRHELMKLSDIEAVSGSVYIPGKIVSSGQNIQFATDAGVTEITTAMNFIGADYFNVYKNKFIAGKNFTDNRKRHSKSLIINRKLSRELGFTKPVDAIGKSVLWTHGNQEKTIISVVEDFFHESPVNEIYPLAFHFAPDVTGYYSIKTTSKSPGNLMNDIKGLWNKIHSGNPFDFFWLDDSYNAQYNQWIMMKKFFIGFAGLVILIAVTGLAGLVGLLLISRIKEIGIRKVNGASIIKVLVKLNGDFLKWMIFAFFIAFPLTWIAMKQWLENFAYKTEISWWIFGLSGLVVLSIALLTVSFQSYKTAKMNPVEALKYE